MPARDRFLSGCRYIQGTLRDERPVSAGGGAKAPLLEGHHETPGAVPDDQGTPWKEMFTSRAVWAIVVGHMCNNWGFYCLLTCLPSYLNNVLNYDIKHAGFVAGLPYLCMAVWVSPLSSTRVHTKLGDFLS